VKKPWRRGRAIMIESVSAVISEISGEKALAEWMGNYYKSLRALRPLR